MSELIAYRTARDVVTVAGDEAESFLAGQLSQDVEGLEAGEPRWSFLLQPTGKLGFWTRVTRLGEEWWLDLDAGFGDAVVERLDRFLLRTKATVEGRRLPIVAVRGRGAGEVRADASVVVDAGWPGEAGVDLLGQEEVPPGAVEVDDVAFETRRIEAGIPRHGLELVEGGIPAETGLVPRSVSFTKGCYTGQELVARIDSRGGNVPRLLRRLRAPGVELRPGDQIVVDGADIGEVTSGVVGVGLGYVRRSALDTVEAEITRSGQAVGVTRIEGLPPLS